MRKIIILLVLLTFIFSCNSSKNAVDRNTNNKVLNQPLANSLLWKISGNDLEKPSYLFGTIHLTCNFQLKDKVKKALDETTRLTLEIDLDDPLLQTKTMNNIMMKDGQSIDKLLTAEEYNKLKVFIKEQTGMPLDMLKTMKPFTLSSMITMKFMDCPAPLSYEDEFVKVVKKDNEEVLGLETIESQFEVFDKIPYKVQLDELLKMANEGVEKSKNELTKLNLAYEKEDVQELIKLMTDYEGMEKDYNDILLDDRNIKWIPVIKKMSKEEPTFFGFGAMHLGGENGVIKLLRKEGFKVEPIM